MRFFTLLSLLGWLCLPTISWGQSPGAVMFRSGSEQFPANVNAFVASGPIQDAFDGHYYRWVQFQATPDQATRDMMQQDGLTFMSYVPHATYLVSFPVSYDRSLLLSYPVRSVMAPTALQKVAPMLTDGPTPDWAIHGQEIDLTIVFPADASPNAVFNALQSQDITILGKPTADHTLDVTVGIGEVFDIAALPYLTWVEPIPEPGEPEDDQGRNLSRANVIGSMHPMGRHYDGTGIKVMVRDDGPIGPHIDFHNRVTEVLPLPAFGDHGDGVASMMSGAPNLDPTAAGTAPGSYMYIADYEASFTDQTLPLHISDTVVITNSSYSNGCNAGYTTNTRRVDQQMHENFSLMHVFSAGNSNNSNCGYGAGNQWGNITGGHKQGKNVVAVANLNTLGILENSSSRGPAHDGRIKPDLAANGQGQINAETNNTYGVFGGTSAAAPTAAGSFAQLYQAYREMHGDTFPDAALIKALFMNTAEDYGNPGPDFRFGWGRVNAYRALLSLENNQYFSSTVGLGATNAHTINVPANVSEMRVMVYWADVEGAPNAVRALVNNIDMTMTDPGSTSYLPLVLDPTPNPATLNLPAVPGIDSLNNVEQVRITNPAAGAYTLSVTGTDLPFGDQEYFVVYEFISDEITVTHPYGGEGFAPGETVRIQWDAYGDAGSFDLEYTLDNGNTWQPIATVPGVDRLYDWPTPTGTVSGEAKVRISRGGISDDSEFPFSLMPPPGNIDVLFMCDDKAQVTWDAVPGAVAYQVYVLGDRFMDSVIRTTELAACVPLVDAENQRWFAVAAVPPNGLPGRRSFAVQYTDPIISCESRDLAVTKLVTPSDPAVTLCFDDSIRVRFLFTNVGDSMQTNFDFGYQFGSNTPGTQTYTAILGACESEEVEFVESLGNLPAGTYVLKTWTSLSGDQNIANDTLFTEITIKGVPFEETFESFDVCGTATNCEGEICGLQNGWRNWSNGIEDDVDWRVNQGGTPSPSTGPNSDHTLGNGDGKYVYLESSGGCTNREAILASPCVDMAGLTQPTLTFWYHMFGDDITSLHVDVNIGAGWVNDVMAPLVGSQGGIWQQATVNMSAYAGQKGQFRIRGYTGSDFEGDIALDDIQFFDASAPPVANFSSELTEVCPVEQVQFIDETIPTPQNWTWSFTPDDVVYLSNTDSTSANPIVIFPTLGTYDVSLTVTGTNGSTTENKTTYVNVSPGEPVGSLTTFEPEVLCGTASNCADENCVLGANSLWHNVPNGEGDQIDWRVNAGPTPSVNTGPNADHTLGTSGGKYLYVEASNCTNQFALLQSDCIDLQGVDFPFISFWYHMRGVDVASLQMDVLSNGTWNFNVMSPIVGDQGNQWQKIRISLVDYAGQSIQIRIRAFSGPGAFGDIAIDDIQLEQVIAPVADFAPANVAVCLGSTITFNDSSAGDSLSYQWVFSGGTPATATTAGPHDVSWSSLGTKAVALVVSNEVGADTLIQLVDVTNLPTASFLTTPVATDTFEFASNSSANVTGYLWDFGDGTTSTDSATGHRYTTDGNYTVTLVVNNVCGTDTFTQDLTVTVGFIDDLLLGIDLSVAPNPNDGNFSVVLEGDRVGDVTFTLLDLRGRALHEQQTTFPGGTYREEILAPELAKGVYMLRIRMEGRTVYRQVIVE